MRSRKVTRRIVIYVSVLVLLLLAFWIGVMNPTFTRSDPAKQPAVSASELKQHVTALTQLQRPRQHANPASLAAAAGYIRQFWTGLGLSVEEQPYTIGGQEFRNLIVSFGPRDAERLVIGAHYDVCGDQPGADDNASGVAGLLELSKLLKEHPQSLNRRIDLVAYSTEEPPYFASHDMGSWVHARKLKDSGAKVLAMLSLEMIGYYSDEKGSQRYPMPLFHLFYPSKGNFISLVGRFSDWGLTRRIKPLMQRSSGIDVYSANAPTAVPGVAWSDQRSYWELDYPALMVTDTSFLRNPNYHEPTDTIDTLDFNRMAEVVKGVYGVAMGLAADRTGDQR